MIMRRIYYWLYNRVSNPTSLRKGIIPIVGIFVLYTGTVTLPLYFIVGEIAAALISLPVILIGFLGGIWFGLAAGLLATIINFTMLYFLQHDLSGDMFVSGLIGHCIIIIMAVVIGRQQDLRKAIENETRARQSAQDALEKQRQLLQRVIDGALDGIAAFKAIRNENSKIVDLECLVLNRAGAKILGRPDNLIGKQLLVELPGFKKNNLFAAFVQVIETGEPYNNEFFYSDEQQAGWFHTRATKFDDGLIVAYTNISPLKATQSKLLATQREKNKLAQIAERIPHGVITTTTKGVITWVNDGFTKMTGYMSAEAIGQVPGHLLQGPDSDPEIIDYMRSQVKNLRPFKTELINYRKDGTPYWVRIETQPMYDENGEVSGFMGIEYDISAQKRYEQALQEAKETAEKAARVKTDFLANMSHEMRTPLNAILGLANLLLDTNLTEQQQDFVATMHDSGNSLLNIINEVLDFSKIDAGKLEISNAPFDLYDTVCHVVDLFAPQAAEKGLEIGFIFAEHVPHSLIGDQQRVHQVLVNLLGNAHKFTDEGAVFVKVDSHPISAHQAQIQLAVHDTGIGMTKASQQRLFQPFTQVDSSATRKFGGTGLGLVISKRLAVAMGGTVEVDSQYGTGSTFKFTFQATLAADEDKGFDQTLQGKSVLLVDDDPIGMQILQHHVERLGATAVSAASGADAITLLRETDTSIALGILDRNMPRMDGITLARKIHNMPKYKSLPLILLSTFGYLAQEDGRHEFAAQLTKPVKTDLLGETVTAILQSRKKALRAQAHNQTALPTGLAEQFPLKILLAEDNRINQKVAMNLLQRMGYSVDIVENGRQAVDAIQKSRYDLILMDIQMPEMDGVSATQAIRQAIHADDLPYIVALTANALKGDRERFLACGMHDYLSKPIVLSDLVTLLQTAHTEKAAANLSPAVK